MKTSFKAIITVVIVIMLSNVNAQGTGTKVPVKKTGNATGNAVAVELKNLSKNQITIFTGRKDELKNPKAKQKLYNGLSTNTLYTSINEVVCIINPQGKPISCAEVKEGVSEIKINSAGIVITAK